MKLRTPALRRTSTNVLRRRCGGHHTKGVRTVEAPFLATSSQTAYSFVIVRQNWEMSGSQSVPAGRENVHHSTRAPDHVDNDQVPQEHSKNSNSSLQNSTVVIYHFSRLLRIESDSVPSRVLRTDPTPNALRSVQPRSVLHSACGTGAETSPILANSFPGKLPASRRGP